ncbi:MAG: S26 family signal peptidase [Nitriliruptoraceae bacterium]
MPARGLLALVALGAAGVGLRRRLVEVAGASMEPTLVAGEHLVTIPAIRRLLRVGRIVVLEEPDVADHLVVKRVTRVNGDRIEVQGDAGHRSTDSRDWGPVPVTSVRSVVVCRWPRVRDVLL